MLPHSAKTPLLLAIGEAVRVRADIKRNKATIGAAHWVAILLATLGLLRPITDGFDVWSVVWAAVLLIGAASVYYLTTWRQRRRRRRLLRNLNAFREYGFRLEHDRPNRLRRRSDDTIWNVGFVAFFHPDA